MSDDIFKFSNDNLKKAQDKLAEKEVFELNDDNYDEYAEFILDSCKDKTNIKCIKNKCRYCYEHMFMSSYVECSLDGSSFSRDSNRECVIPRKINELHRQIEILEKYGKFVEFKGK